MKMRIFTVLFLTASLLFACKEPDFVDTTEKLIPSESAETAKVQFFEDFHSYRIVYTPPFITEVTDRDGNILLTFEGCEYRVSGELLIISTVGEDPDYLIYKKDLSPITADGKPAEFAHKFDEIAMCEDGGFTAAAKHEGVLLRFAPSGDLVSSSTFEKLFTAGIKPEQGNPIAAASNGDTFKFVTSEGEVMAELPFAPHLNYLNSYYSERDGREGLYFHVAFKGGVTYYFCPESEDAGVIGLDLPSDELIYNNNYISAYRTDNGIEVRQRLSGDIHLYDDVLIGEYYDPVFGKAEKKAVFIKHSSTTRLYSYNYGSCRVGPVGTDYTVIGNYIYIGNVLYDLNLNSLYTFGSVSLKDYSIDNTSGVVIINGTDAYGDEYIHTFYPTLPVAAIPDDAELLAESTGSLGTFSLYRQGDTYFHQSSESALTLKLPITAEHLYASINARTATIVCLGDGGLKAIDFSYCHVSHPGIGKAPALFVTSEHGVSNATRFGSGDVVPLNYNNIYGYYYISDSGEVKSLNSEYGCSVIGDLLYVYNGPVDYSGMVYNKEMEPIYDGILCHLTKLDDGRYTAFTKETKQDLSEGNKDLTFTQRAVVFDEEAKLIYQCENDRYCFLVGKGFTLMLDADSSVRLYDNDQNELCTFFKWNDSYMFRDLVSGRYEKDGKIGYYFHFEDRSDNNEYGERRHLECYYIPSTGEYGVVGND